MSYLTQTLRNAYDQRDRDQLERAIARVEALEQQQPTPAQPAPDSQQGEAPAVPHDHGE